MYLYNLFIIIDWTIVGMGATVVLLHAIPSSPLAQPRNLIVGHLLSSIIGVSVFKLSNLLIQDPQSVLWYLFN